VDFFGWLNQMMLLSNNAASAAVPQTASPQADPLALWKSFTEKNEETWTKFMQEAVSTPEFAQAFGRTANSNASYRQMVKQTAKSYLEAADMPSRDDLTRLAEQIVLLDAKVDNIEDGLTDNFVGIPQLLGRIIFLLENVHTRLEQLEGRVLTREEIAPVAERLAALVAKTPSKEEINNLGSRLEALETKIPSRDDLSGIGERLATLENKTLSRDDLSGIGERLAAIENKTLSRDDLSGIGERLAAIETNSLTREEFRNVSDRLAVLEVKTLSRDDLNGIGEHLAAIETKVVSEADLNNLGERLAALEIKLPDREEFSKIGTRLAALEGQISNLESASTSAKEEAPTPSRAGTRTKKAKPTTKLNVEEQEVN
jgi:tetrahydromethanopterin S-methyltransferase subunit G